jgi:hypothetical protein
MWHILNTGSYSAHDAFRKSGIDRLGLQSVPSLSRCIFEL